MHDREICRNLFYFSTLWQHESLELAIHIDNEKTKMGGSYSFIFLLYHPFVVRIMGSYALLCLYFSDSSRSVPKPGGARGIHGTQSY